MSMKRTKQRGSGGRRDKDIDQDFWAKPKEAEKTWEQATENQPEEAFIVYAMTNRYTKGQLVLHPKFGKGIVTDVEASRVEILFQEGKKKLGHGASG